MSFTDDRYIEALRQEFRRNSARVWEDESIPFGKKQGEVDRLWKRIR